MKTLDATSPQPSSMMEYSGAVGGAGDNVVLDKMAEFDKSQRILVVDDEPEIVDEMKDFLQNKGHSCETAYSAQEALKKLEAVPEISIVLTDVRMPGMSGLELLGTLRKPPYADRQIEVVVLTGHAGRDEAIQALHNGAIDFLIKPVSLKKVQFAVFRAHEVLRTRFMEMITRQKMAETLEEERHTSQIQREFVAMISHEFRTPLAIIDGAAQRLIRRKDIVTSEEVVERADRIRVAVTRMTTLIDDTLGATRLDAGVIKYAPAACHPIDLIRMICQNQQDLHPRHDVVFDAGSLPENIVADAGLLEQVLVNMVANAIKYTPEGNLVEVVGGGGDGYMTVSVHDKGIGIPTVELPHLFDRYFRASNTTGIPGTGIGLYWVKRLVEMHGGSICVQSVEDEGSTFTIKIPNTPPIASLDEVERNTCENASSDGSAWFEGAGR